MKKYEFQVVLQLDLKFSFFFIIKLNLVFEVSKFASGHLHVMGGMDFPFYYNLLNYLHYF